MSCCGSIFLPNIRFAPTCLFVDLNWVGPYSTDMAPPTIKSAYSLDAETVRQLESLAKHRNISKAAARRRAIRLTTRRRRNTFKAATHRRTNRLTTRKHRNTFKVVARRRTIRTMVRPALPLYTESLDALDRLQRLLSLDRQTATEWENEVKRERHAAS